ncbi:hypothetical protein A3C98_04025 [Candidatus Roizmanbacteria bacterium RIFCSPHIGHO2_02_FULL_37_15]|uniref:Uncharacterized protein n=1 Tax=Candidatus Roizmanbacteria bacterium RIFCSPLOWO2_01_FULL_37_16 TaxID=1802058 RepID=A0A1F7IMI4_9BACT|nr:MAG: hypothetical protein A2859_04235 [Candidatus Roizmanbacteria bacterium RIFCSPHIGHO2_01_FULL_37_16b]OGK22491.1 MAG: hypothetical protein A3C98_04025 [Candidatus Roizmanbacteria bacterium RIFCSPHIGHO2_02_FULL_37_15]OGK44581.1 MAG: hypothetical protein A3B40_05355 [Candidatus Roizmanbacteria bacterium RIFCSPLOWO2_01_FULL_37_16]OGK56859.1 MAG: hypothetical protein A3I50_03235 [Candidatus Roizmanbacteria bacterium RIFCSPLOWO2_02_FULL_37_9]
MSDALILNLFIFLFFVFTVLENYYKPKLSKIEKIGRQISPVVLFLLIVIGTTFVIYFLIYGPRQFVSLYLKFLLSALVLSHALWISLKKNFLTKLIFLVASLIFIATRFIYPSTFNHNLLILAAVIWLAPFFTYLNLMTKKRFLIISGLWFLYDIIFVWLTPLAQGVISTTKIIDFSLALTSGKSSIGIADLFWAGFLLSLLKKTRSKFIAIFILIGSNFMLEFYARNISRISLFPLLVLWVPLGILIIFYEKQTNPGRLL